jgi:hypothetical protein
MGDGGKGSRARPFSVDQKTFDTNWDAIFGRRPTQTNTEHKPIEEVTTKKENKQNES